MDVKEFVSENLKQAIEAVADAQKYAKGKKAAVAPYRQNDGQVEFDIAVTATEAKEVNGKAGLTVCGVGAGVGGKSESSSSTVSRVKFSVAVDWPQEDERPELADDTDDYTV